MKEPAEPTSTMLAFGPVEKLHFPRRRRSVAGHTKLWDQGQPHAGLKVIWT